MQIVEVKNNLVKISYEPSQEELILSCFLAIKETTQIDGTSFIGQVMHLEATARGHFAIVKLLFNFDSTGTITNYNGAIPSVNSSISYVETQSLLGLLPVQNPVVIGEIAQQSTILKLDESVFGEKLVVCCEREEDKKLLVQNINAQLLNSGKKVLVIDLSGDFDFSSNIVTAGENFKLPLNYQTINFIYEKGLDKANAETKALIQEVFLEVQEYVKTLPEGFIPFESFKDVVDQQYQELGIVELVLLKNKLLKYYEDGIFAQDKSQFDSLEVSLANSQTTILDLSCVEEQIQREVIAHAYSLIEKSSREVYVLVNVDNSNSDKKLLKQIYTNKMAHSVVICPYTYKYLTELKQLAKDLILFAPIVQQKDFAGYNTFLNKLNPSEFIIYGSSTHNIPLIVKLDSTPQQMFEQRHFAEETVEQEGFSNTVEGHYQSEYQPQQEAQKEVHNEAQGQQQWPSQYEEETQYEQPQGFLPEESPVTFEEVSHQEMLDAQIRQDVGQLYTAPRQDAQQNFTQENYEQAPVDWQTPLPSQGYEQNEWTAEGLTEGAAEDLTENDLDFIDDVNIVTDEAFAQEDTQTAPVEGFGDDFGQEFFEERTEQFVQPSFEQEMTGQQIKDIPDFAAAEEEKPSLEILPASEASIPSLPIYSAEVEDATDYVPGSISQGDVVMHVKYGKGTVEKMINYGSKTLCSINFDNVGRRLLDPSLAELKKL